MGWAWDYSPLTVGLKWQEAKCTHSHLVSNHTASQGLQQDSTACFLLTCSSSLSLLLKRVSIMCSWSLRTTKEQMSGWVGGLLTKSCMGIPWLQEAQCLWMQHQSQLSLKPVSHGVHQTTWYLSPQSGPGQLHGHVTYRPVQPPLPQMSISTNQPL